MPWDPAETAQARIILAEASSVRDAAARLRERYAPLRVTVVDAMDMRGEQPALRAGTRALYLASTNGHCWTVTQQPADTAALILAEESP